MKHLGNTVELGCRIGGSLGILAGNQHVDVAPDLGCGFGGGVQRQFTIVDFGE